MSDIPFIARLGDAFEAAIAAPQPQPRRAAWPRRRTLTLAVAALVALAAAAIAIAHVLSSPDELAARNVACYTSANLSSNVTVVANDRAAVAACADAYRAMGQSAPALVACANGGSVAVIPGASAAACAQAGLTPLPEGYAQSQAKVARLSQAVMALESNADCVAPTKLAAEVQRLLAIQGWVGWKAAVHSPLGGPCGTVSGLDGAGRRSIDGALDPSAKIVLVSGAASRSTITLLYGANGLARQLEDVSGSRCFTLTSLAALVHSRAEAAGRSASIEVAPPLPPAASFADGRQQRYHSGCAVLTDIRAASDGHNLVAVVPKSP